MARDKYTPFSEKEVVLEGRPAKEFSYVDFERDNLRLPHIPCAIGHIDEYRFLDEEGGQVIQYFEADPRPLYEQLSEIGAIIEDVPKEQLEQIKQAEPEEEEEESNEAKLVDYAALTSRYRKGFEISVTDLLRRYA